MAKVKVNVRAVKRDGYAGYGVLGRYFKSGEDTVIEVESEPVMKDGLLFKESELAILRNEQWLSVSVLPDEPAPTQATDDKKPAAKK